MSIPKNRKGYLAFLIAIATITTTVGTTVRADGLSTAETGFKLDRRTASVAYYEYVVYELAPGSTSFDIGDSVIRSFEGTPPYETTIGGSGPDAGTKIRLIPQQ